MHHYPPLSEALATHLSQNTSHYTPSANSCIFKPHPLMIRFLPFTIYPVLDFSEAFIPSPTPISLFSLATGFFWDLVHI